MGLCNEVLSVINFIAPIRNLRVKYNTKSWFDIDVSCAIRNRDKHYRKFKGSGKEIVKDIIECAKLLFKKVINNKKNLSFQEKIAENSSID